MSPLTTPSSPTTPGTFVSRGSTTICEDPKKDSAEDQPQTVADDYAAYDKEKGVAAQDDFVIDPESLEKRPTKRSLSDYAARVGTGFSNKLPTLPVHWHHNYLPEDRNSQRIDDHPEGYPRLAALLNSDENFLIARRYGLLHARVMLYRQDELHELENELLALDAEDAEVDPRALKSRKRDDRREGQERKQLINAIDEKLKQYDDIVLRARSMASLQKASTRNYTSVYNWMYHNAPLAQPETEFMKNDEDFVALVDPKEVGWFDGFIEDVLSMFPCRLTRLLFSTPAQRASTSDKEVYLYSKDRIDTLVRLVITILAVALLMAPVVVLFQAEESGVIKIVVILVFTLFFSAALSIFTKAQRHEVFAATAA